MPVMLTCSLCLSSLPGPKYGRRLKEREARHLLCRNEAGSSSTQHFACLLCVPRLKWMMRVAKNVKDGAKGRHEDATRSNKSNSVDDGQFKVENGDIPILENAQPSKNGDENCCGDALPDVNVPDESLGTHENAELKDKKESPFKRDGDFGQLQKKPIIVSDSSSKPSEVDVEEYRNNNNNKEGKEYDGGQGILEMEAEVEDNNKNQNILSNKENCQLERNDEGVNGNSNADVNKHEGGVEEKVKANGINDSPSTEGDHSESNRNVIIYEDSTAKCAFCDYRVPRNRAADIYRTHIPRKHPKKTALLASYKSRIRQKREDRKVRATLSCLLCSQTATKLSNLTRHYSQIHGYDKKLAETKTQDGDGALCPICGDFFLNTHQQMRHLLKKHTLIESGETCPYCQQRYVDLSYHIDKMHMEQKQSKTHTCTKCLPHQHFRSFDDVLKHARIFHRGRGSRQVTKNVRKATRKPENTSTTASIVTTTTATSPKTGVNTTPPAIFTPNNVTTTSTVNVTPVTPNVETCSETEIRRTSKKYVPIHLSGICPFCDRKFADLLGHIRHGHKDMMELSCRLCEGRFASVRELVSHRQLHPQFVRHECHKCGQQADTIKELRQHRQVCPKMKKRQRVRVSNSGVTEMFEGRGTVNCFLCSTRRSFTLKCLLRRHLVSQHGYDPKQAITALPAAKEDGHKCDECNQTFGSFHQLVKHRFDFHCRLSGEICPYCESKWGSKKFENLDEHVAKYHLLEMQSPIQTCATCKTNFSTYEELKRHRQLHDGNVQLGPPAETHNRGGVKCLLCNAFKTRKDHLRVHYRRRHGYDPKLVVSNSKRTESTPLSEFDSVLSSCPCCHILLPNMHSLIKHLLRVHTHYSGQICPYCIGHFPSRFIDLQAHVTACHMDRLMGYNAINKCMVCDATFAGFAELRDHVQTHGDGYRIGHKTPKEPAQGKVEVPNREEPILEPGLESLPSLDHRDVALTLAAEGEDDNNTSFSTLLLDELMKKCDEEDTPKAGDSANKSATDIDLLAPTC